VPRKILLFGGSFNPIHDGHLAVARSAAEKFGAERTVFVPAAQPPHKSADIAPAGDRLEMIRAAIAGDAALAVSDVELARSGRSYTVHTVEQMLADNPGAEIGWLIGADTALDLASWYRVEELADLCTFVVVARPGFDLKELDRLAVRLRPDQIHRIRGNVLTGTPLVDVSSTRVRAAAAAGESLAGLVPGPVADYIRKKGLYRT
jgi:nicotinate-nucleotide adenylyltransferase